MAMVDVIIPLYNKANTIERTLKSILAQTFKNFNIIIVNDGSTDGSDKIAEKFARDERISLINQPNCGPGAARNTGIKAATAPIIAFLDADDQWHSCYLQNSVTALEQAHEKDNTVMVGTMYHEWPKRIDMTSYWAKRGVTPGTYSLSGSEDPFIAQSLMFFFHVGNSIVYREIAKKYKGFYENRCTKGEDTMFFMKVVINEKVKVIGPPAVVHHRQDSSLSNKNIKDLLAFIEDPEIILKYAPPGKKQLMKNIIAVCACSEIHNKARNGYKKEAKQVLELVPEIKNFPKQYAFLKREIVFSGIIKYYVYFKRLIGPPFRKYLNIIREKLGLDKKPKLP